MVRTVADLIEELEEFRRSFSQGGQLPVRVALNGSDETLPFVVDDDVIGGEHVVRLIAIN